jgi:hypothetical protein
MVDQVDDGEDEADAEELISDAIDTLAVLYPVASSDDAKEAWFKWLRDILEERAPLVQADLDEIEHDEQGASGA